MMTKRSWTLGLISTALLALPLAVACGSDDSGDDGSGGGEQRETGSACTRAEQCWGGKLCLTDNTFTELSENGAEAEIPGGYCSMLVCEKNQAEGECGPHAYCFDLEQFVETPLTACFHVCETDTDCRADEGYICTDFAGSQYEQLPKKACLPPSLMCLLDVPQPSCPDVGPDAGAGGSAGGGGSAGAGGAGGSAGTSGGGGSAGSTADAG